MLNPEELTTAGGYRQRSRTFVYLLTLFLMNETLALASKSMNLIFLFQSFMWPLKCTSTIPSVLSVCSDAAINIKNPYLKPEHNFLC